MRQTIMALLKMELKWRGIVAVSPLESAGSRIYWQQKNHKKKKNQKENLLIHYDPEVADSV